MKLIELFSDIQFDGIDQDDLDDFAEEFEFEVASALVKTPGEFARYSSQLKPYKDQVLKELENFEEVSIHGGEYSRYGVFWVFKHKPSGKLYRITADADSWNDDGAFGEGYEFAEVFEKTVTKQVWMSEEELKETKDDEGDSWE